MAKAGCIKIKGGYKMALLTREDILNYNDIKTEIVPVPEWGGEVKVKD